MVGKTFSASSNGTLTRTVSSFESVLSTRTCSQRSCVEVSEDFFELFWATPALGESAKAAAAINARAENFRVRLVMASNLLRGRGEFEIPRCRTIGV